MNKEHDYSDIFNIIINYYESYESYKNNELLIHKKKYKILMLDLEIFHLRNNLRELLSFSTSHRIRNYHLIFIINQEIQDKTEIYIELIRKFRLIKKTLAI